MTRRIAPAVLIAFAIGCETVVEPGEPNWVPIEYIDEGNVCFGDAEADQSVTIEVWADDCLSSSCSRNESASCEVTVDGDTITLTSTLSWENNEGERTFCTDDCGSLGAECTLDGLPAGTYTIDHGDQQLTLDVPSTGDCGG